jgi:hypothetical protein
MDMWIGIGIGVVIGIVAFIYFIGKAMGHN